jgi:hypothetical protein
MHVEQARGWSLNRRSTNPMSSRVFSRYQFNSRLIAADLQPESSCARMRATRRDAQLVKGIFMPVHLARYESFQFHIND